ncbi:unnamed protein product, partial [marine sediment metagenome]
PFWTTPLIGYVIYGEYVEDLIYKKTVDGGANWSAAVPIRAGYIVSYDCWADWQTAGDVGTKIHIVYIDYNSDDIRYVYLDTSTDTVGGDDQIVACQGTGSIASYGKNRGYSLSTITKTRGGNLAVAIHHTDDAEVHFYSFYTSPDATNWTSKNTPWEAEADDILLFPGNEADN